MAGRKDDCHRKKFLFIRFDIWIEFFFRIIPNTFLRWCRHVFLERWRGICEKTIQPPDDKFDGDRSVSQPLWLMNFSEGGPPPYSGMKEEGKREYCIKRTLNRKNIFTMKKNSISIYELESVIWRNPLPENPVQPK